MAYAGRQPITGFRSTPTKDSFNGDNSTTEFTLSLATRTNDVEVFVENVQQEPVTAYSISGNTLTFTSAPPTGTGNIYVIHRAELVSNGVHTPGANLDAGVTTLDSLTVTGSADINGGTIDGVTIGGASAGAGTFTTLDVNGTTTITNPAGGTVAAELVFGTGGNAENAKIEGATPTTTTGILKFYTDTAGTLTEKMRIDSSGNVGVGTDSPSEPLHVYGSALQKILVQSTGSGAQLILQSDNGSTADIMFGDTGDISRGLIRYDNANESMQFWGNNLNERMRIDSSGNLIVGKDNTASTNTGLVQYAYGRFEATTSTSTVARLNRQGNDGYLIEFLQAGSSEGRISVSGSTVSYVGGHLARNSRLLDDSKDTSIVKGTVMTNLDEMVVWSHPAVEAVDAVYDEDGNLITEAVEAKEAYTEDNEQLNKMAVSSAEGDPNVAGVFVNWDEEDDFNDMNIAMTGDMVIRIAQGTTVQRGDLLMSAGDGTAKPQGDDIVRSKTIAKVTSTHVSHTYDDGSYLVPCVLMAC